MTDAQQQQILDLFAQHQYLLLTYAVMAVLIGFIVRLCKSDSPIPWLRKIDPAWRAEIAVFLGVIGGVFTALASKTPPATAILFGLMSAFTAISGHQIVVEGFRAGREPFAPLSKPSPPPASKSPRGRPTPPPPPPPRAAMGLMMDPFSFGARAAICLLVAGCAAIGAVPAVIPAASCIADIARITPALSFLQYIATAISRCGGDILAVIDAIIASQDPAVAQYKPEAQAAKADPAKLEELRAKVKAYRAAHPELLQDGGP